MKSSRSKISQVWSIFFRGIGLYCSPIIFWALLGRTGFFFYEFNREHSACVVGWTFLYDLTSLSLLGTLFCLPFSLAVFISDFRNKKDLAAAGFGLVTSCSLVPMAMFLGLLLPQILVPGINFD